LVFEDSKIQQTTGLLIIAAGVVCFGRWLKLVKVGAWCFLDRQLRNGMFGRVAVLEEYKQSWQSGSASVLQAVLAEWRCLGTASSVGRVAVECLSNLVQGCSVGRVAVLESCKQCWQSGSASSGQAVVGRVAGGGLTVQAAPSQSVWARRTVLGAWLIEGQGRLC
jgi:hypothetical protein